MYISLQVSIVTGGAKLKTSPKDFRQRAHLLRLYENLVWKCMYCLHDDFQKNRKGQSKRQPKKEIATFPAFHLKSSISKLSKTRMNLKLALSPYEKTKISNAIEETFENVHQNLLLKRPPSNEFLNGVRLRTKNEKRRYDLLKKSMDTRK